MAAAMALGAQGVWTGSVWLTVEEADVPDKVMESYLDAGSRDTIRSRSFTGKPARMLKNDWTEAWASDDTPDPLGMPLQFFVSGEAVSRGHKYPEQAVGVAFAPVGQIVGSMKKVRKAGDVVINMAEEYLEATGRLEKLNNDAL